jgi:hypothetical protein
MASRTSDTSQVARPIRAFAGVRSIHIAIYARPNTSPPGGPSFLVRQHRARGGRPSSKLVKSFSQPSSRVMPTSTGAMFVFRGGCFTARLWPAQIPERTGQLRVQLSAESTPRVLGRHVETHSQENRISRSANSRFAQNRGILVGARWSLTASGRRGIESQGPKDHCWLRIFSNRRSAASTRPTWSGVRPGCSRWRAPANQWHTRSR